MFDGLQYRFLKRVFPAPTGLLNADVYQSKCKTRVLLGEEIMAQLKGLTVLDYGCGTGEESVHLVLGGAGKVVGLDIREETLAKGRSRAAQAGVSDRIEFTTECREPVDAIISLDAFEHFDRPDEVLEHMYSLLKPGGFMATSFGPLWRHPLGGHVFSVFPWAHLIFSEQALIEWRSAFYDDGATRFSEVSGGLNRMTISRFESLVARSDFEVVFVKPEPIRVARRFHNRWTREYLTSVLKAVLRRPA